MTIGATFALSLIVAPVLNRFIGVPGIFALTGVLALLAIGVVYAIIPDPQLSHFHSDAEAQSGQFVDVLRDRELLRLDFGVFALHAVLMALWMVVPFSLRTYGLAADHHWQVYLPVLLGSAALMIPAIVYAERKARLKPVLVASVALMLAAQVLLAMLPGFWGLVFALLAFFTRVQRPGSEPAVAYHQSRAGRRQGHRDRRLQQYSVSGMFAGAAGGGIYPSITGPTRCSARAPRGVMAGCCGNHETACRGAHKDVSCLGNGRPERGVLSQRLAAAGGARSFGPGGEGVAYLKVDMKGFDEQHVLELIGGET